VAIHNGNELLAEIRVRSTYSHSKKLAVMVQNVLSLANLTRQELEAIAVSAGPGSYTGLRIGGSLAKGLCFALDIPLIAIDTLPFMAAAMAAQVGNVEALYMPMIDARREEVYAGIYNNNGEVLLPVQPLILSDGSVDTWLDKGTLYYAGDGAEKARKYLQRDSTHYLPDFEPQASQMGIIAAQKFQNSQFENLADWEPIYLKDGLNITGR